jgi:hypothetical protein
VQGGQQVSAAIYAKTNIDTDGSGAKQVRLIFRDHPEWGRSSYLTLQAGDFDCYGGCKVKVGVDDARPSRWRRRDRRPTRRSRCSSRTSARCGDWRARRRS